MGSHDVAREESPFRSIAHEILNSLTSLRGCAQTLLLEPESLSEETRLALSEIVGRQSRILEWLVRAAVAREDPGEPRTVVSVRELARRACAFANVDFEDDGVDATLHASPHRLEQGVTALTLALSDGDARAHARLAGGVSLTLESDAVDLDFPARSWKLDLSRRILRQQGCRMRVQSGAQGSSAFVLFSEAAVVAVGSERRFA